jgi:alkanesulfonate monooxygenase SsuD/methylene tetrahydromethanopterin reductase-like flavin-dependent oxidoreductase (luciferase family)
VEHLGFDSLWVGDHALGSFDGLTAAALFAAATERIVIGNSVLVLPLRDPVLTARALSTLALEIPERYVLGIGAGGDIPAEFEAVGVPLARRGARMISHLEVVASALDEGVVGIHRFADRPPRGMPPVWMGGRTERSALRAGSLADGLVPYLVTPTQFQALRQLTQDARASADRLARPFSYGVNILVSVAESSDLATRQLRSVRPYDMTDAQLDRYTIAGTPRDVVRGLRPYADAGADHAILDLVGEGRHVQESLKLLADALEGTDARSGGS